MELEILKVGELETNCYLVIKDGKCLIIDPGADENYIIERIKTLEVEVMAILVTHNHFDHIGALDRLKEVYGVESYDQSNLFEGKQYFEPFNFQVVYTPGHSKDSISFYFYDYDIMFTGDFVFREDIGRVDLPSSSYEDMLQSIKKIKEFDPDTTLYPGHGESTTLEHEKDVNEYFK